MTDEQWALLDPLIPDPLVREGGHGRPWRDKREVLDGILWILRMVAPWKEFPDRYPPHTTCHRCLQQWIKAGVFRDVLVALAEDLRDRGGFDLDGTFASAKKGASR